MQNFKTGDQVRHMVHGLGTVTDYDEAKNLVTVHIPNRMGYVHVHPTSLTLVPAVANMRTPQLVREFVEMKCRDARGNVSGLNANDTVRLDRIVNELRSRGVLD
jgi:hypothetical protein